MKELNDIILVLQYEQDWGWNTVSIENNLDAAKETYKDFLKDKALLMPEVPIMPKEVIALFPETYHFPKAAGEVVRLVVDPDGEHMLFLKRA